MKSYSEILIAIIISSLLVISSCKKEELIIEGCTDSTAMNYNSTATSNDGSCVYCVYGCIDSTQFNYNPLATCDDGSCVDCVYGCIDSTQFNYNPLATCDDGSCIPITYGCTDSTALNYNSAANADDATCIYAYDVAQGTWNITPNCEDINLPIIGPISLDTILPESIDVQGAGNGSLFIDINGAQISGDIDNSGNITVAEQTVSIDLVGLGIPIPVQISGSGKIESENSGYMDLTFSGEIDLIPGLPVSFNSTCHITLSK